MGIFHLRPSKSIENSELADTKLQRSIASSLHRLNASAIDDLWQLHLQIRFIQANITFAHFSDVIQVQIVMFVTLKRCDRDVLNSNRKSSVATVLNEFSIDGFKCTSILMATVMSSLLNAFRH